VIGWAARPWPGADHCSPVDRTTSVDGQGVPVDALDVVGNERRLPLRVPIQTSRQIKISLSGGVMSHPDLPKPGSIIAGAPPPHNATTRVSP